MRKFCATSLADFFNVTVTTIDIYKVLNALKVSEYYHKNGYFPTLVLLKSTKSGLHQRWRIITEPWMLCYAMYSLFKVDA